MKLLNEILGTKYPIIQGGMANIATGEFAAACSNAGALGIIGAGGMDADTLRQNIRRCKQLTDKPFGVNIMLMSPHADEVAQVVAAGHAISPDAENAAVISKMLRVMMLAPFLILLAARVKQLSGANSGEKSKITIPWFAILFIVVAIFNSFHLLPQSVVNMLVTLDTFLLAMAMAALGLTTHVSALKKAGAKPLLMALVLFAWLIVGGGAINYVIQSVIA